LKTHLKPRGISYLETGILSHPIKLFVVVENSTFNEFGLPNYTKTLCLWQTYFGIICLIIPFLFFLTMPIFKEDLK